MQLGKDISFTYAGHKVTGWVYMYTDIHAWIVLLKSVKGVPNWKKDMANRFEIIEMKDIELLTLK